MLPMQWSRGTSTARWSLAFGALAGIVLVYRLWLHVNPTTVALTLLLFILVLAAEWEVRYAVAISIAATACYNFFFLPPVGTFTIADPQNWLALFAFLATTIIASRLAQRARDRANDARFRQRELEVLLRLSRELLQLDNIVNLLSEVPSAVVRVAGARSGIVYLLEENMVYASGVDTAADSTMESELGGLRQAAMSLPSARRYGDAIQAPIRSGVRPRGLLVLRSAALSLETADAIGSLVSISIDRAQALESVARAEAAKESERFRTLMIDSITHQLRTPLTSIKGAATTLLTTAVRQEESLELLTIIDEESDRLNTLVSEAVEMAQLDAHQVRMHFVPVRVCDLIRNARVTCAWVEEQHELQIDVSDRLELSADAAALQKVICNLLENAAKYSRPGTPITIAAESQGQEIAISVADCGVGIHPSEQSLIFERFYRARSQPTGVSGTGMGLAISRAIAEAHGGKIIVKSTLGKGAMFIVTIPASGG